jgi:large subunit ribosomal protein L13
MKTYSARKEDVQRDWYVVDAEGKVLGRLACEIASRLRGKHKPVYTPHVDTGGLKSITAEKLLQTRPEEVLRIAVQGMLPKNTLGRQMLRKLKIYKGSTHGHEAQSPRTLEL